MHLLKNNPSEFPKTLIVNERDCNGKNRMNHRYRLHLEILLAGLQRLTTYLTLVL